MLCIFRVLKGIVIKLSGTQINRLTKASRAKHYYTVHILQLMSHSITLRWWEMRVVFRKPCHLVGKLMCTSSPLIILPLMHLHIIFFSRPCQLLMDKRFWRGTRVPSLLRFIATHPNKYRIIHNKNKIETGFLLINASSSGDGGGGGGVYSFLLLYYSRTYTFYSLSIFIHDYF